MNFKVIGRYGAYPRKGGASNCYIVDDKVIADFGSGAISGIGESLINYPIILSHMHFDHISDMFTLRYMLAALKRDGRLNKKIPVYTPEYDCPQLSILLTDPNLEFRFVKDGDEINLNGLQVKFFDVLHAGLPTVGATFSKDGITLGYTSDSVECDNLKKLCNASNACICDAAGLKPGLPHIELSKLAEICKEHDTHMYLSHLSTDDGKEAVEIVREITKNYTLCKEGQTYCIE